MSHRVSIDPERGTLTIGTRVVDLNVLEAICDPDKHVLWSFELRDGVVKAIPHDESEVLWIAPKK